MKVLIACEFSGIVRDAFKARGHDAWSCDLLPTERKGQHLQMDILDLLQGWGSFEPEKWDLMIAHPPCTYLSYAATRVWDKPSRAEKREQAMAFFMSLVNAPVHKICVENPKGLPMVEYRSPDQTIQPYYFGERQMKTTLLWLKNLPCLAHFEQDSLFGDKKTHTKQPKPIDFKPDGSPRYFTEAMKGPQREHDRSRFWQGIADAMAEQWG